MEYEAASWQKINHDKTTVVLAKTWIHLGANQRHIRSTSGNTKYIGLIDINRQIKEANLQKHQRESIEENTRLEFSSRKENPYM